MQVDVAQCLERFEQQQQILTGVPRAVRQHCQLTLACARLLMWLTSAPTPLVPATSYRDSCDTCGFICEQSRRGL
jgi:hypothetical protein